MKDRKQRRLLRGSLLAGTLLVAGSILGLSIMGQSAVGGKAEVWRFDRTGSLGGHPTKILGHPRLIETPYGKAVEFNGIDDALFVPVHPLAGAETWTWEVIFRPDVGGAPQQRFFHLSVLDSAGQDIDDRMLFETRIVNGQWCLDSFAMAGGQSRALLNCRKLYPLGRWYRVTAVYDGQMLKNYVGDELQGEGGLQLVPQGAGHASIGVRINLKDHFKGAVFEARFTRRPLPVSEFLQMPQTR